MRNILIASSALALAACSTTGNAPPAAMPAAAMPADIVIENVTVIDPEHGAKMAAQDVVVRDGRIVAVLATGSRAIAAPTRVDGSGKWLMPGLFDMHAHSSFRPVHVSTLKMMAANGITGIREMGSDCIEPGGIAMCIDEMRTSQARIEAGEMVGPRIVELSSRKIDSDRPEDATEAQKLYKPTNAEQARETVALLAERRPDILKTGDQFHPDAFRALVTAARERGIKVGGHIPPMLSVAEVADMGLTTIEHARDLPVDCSTYGTVYRGQVMAKIMGEDVPWPDRKALPGKARDTFDKPTCDRQIAAMVRAGSYYVPTHLTREMDYRAGEAAYRNDPRKAYIPAMQQAGWDGDLDRTTKMLGELASDLGDFFRLGLATTRMAHDAGVKVMAGTDANDTMVFPGFSLHDELAHLVAAGLTPMEALQAATSVPAEYLGRSDDFGGVSAGKLADLLLLDADPTVDIANTTQISAVVQGGRMRDRAALDALLREVRDWVQLADQQMKDE